MLHSPNGASLHLRGPCGELDIANAGRVGAALGKGAATTVVVDLAELTFIGGAGLSALVAAWSQFTGEERSFVLRDAGGIVRRAFGICGLSDVLSDAHG